MLFGIDLFSFLIKVNQNLKFLHWASVLIGNLPVSAMHVAWVSGVSGEKGKDGSEKGRELKERNFLSLFPLPPPPSKISYPLAP